MSSRAVARTLILLLAAVLVVLGLTGCPGPTFVVQQYGGPQRPADSVAVVRVNGREPVRLLVLDEQDAAAPIVEDGRLHIEVLPGRHTIVVGNASAPNERYAPVTFQAEAGKVYRVVFPSGAQGEARVFEVDRGKDSLVRDVTQAAQPAAPATAPPPVPPPAPAPPPAEAP
jgi:hypothetical protein